MARSGKSERPRAKPKKSRSDDWAVWLIRTICERAGSMELIADNAELRRIIAEHDNTALFDWLMIQFNYQGISDRVAETYLRDHGSITYTGIQRSLDRSPTCPKLKSYWHFHRCGYVKGKRTCSQPEHFRKCPVPRAPLRNGRLNQTSFSLYLFMRDCAEDDLIGWIDQRLPNTKFDEPKQLQETVTEVVEALSWIYGVSDKVISMALATLFLSAGESRYNWKAAGASLITVDTLVHNWILRTGLMTALGRKHLFGASCYADNGCASIIQRLARHIDASGFNRLYPEYFPRFVQHAIWRFCALDHLNVCNGNRIEDKARCKNRFCILHGECRRRRLSE